MLDRVRKLLLDRKRSPSSAAPRRFSIESLESRLNFSSSTPTLDIALAAVIQDRMASVDALEASRVTVTASAPASEVGSPGRGGNDRDRFTSVLTARRVEESMTLVGLRAQRDKGIATRHALEASRLRGGASLIYSEPSYTLVVVAPPPPPTFAVFVYEIAPNRVFRPPITTRFATPSPRNLIRTSTSTDLSRTAVGHTFPSDMPALNWDSDSGEAQQDSVARSSNPARHDLALVSLKLDRAPVDSESAASVSAIRSGESSVESRGGLAYYEGGLIDIASDRPRDRSLGQKRPGDWGPVKVESNVAAAQDDGIRRITELSQKPEAALDQESQPADEAQVTPVERALADNSEGGLIDLVEIKDAPQVLAEYPVMMAMHAAVEGGTESSDPIQVDRAIGFFRAFELAVAPEGVIEELIGEAVASPDEDSAIETPVSTDAGDFHPVVIPGAAVIPAVLMVGSWAVSTRRKPSRGKQSARGTV